MNICVANLVAAWGVVVKDNADEKEVGGLVT